MAFPDPNEDADLMDEVAETRLAIPGLTADLPIGISWGVGHTLLVYSTKHTAEPQTAAKRRSFANIFTVQWERMTSQAVKQLMTESHGIFVELQVLGAKLARSPHKLTQELVKSSRKYRAVLRSIYLETEQRLLDPQLAHKAEVSNLIAYQRFAERVWHLCEIFFLLADVPAQPLLADWVQSHFPVSDQERETNEELVNRLVSVPQPEEDDEYWGSIYRFAVRGLLDPVAALLERHSLHPWRSEQRSVSKAGETIAVLATLLRKMPVFQTGDTLIDFQARWRQWQQDVKYFAQRHNLQEDQRVRPLKELVSIITGSPDQLATNAATWPELLLGTVTYRHPTMKCNQVRELLDTVLRANKPLDDELLDDFAQSAMALETEEAISKIYSFGNVWLSAHLLDLLHHAGFMDDNQITALGVSERDLAVLDYVMSLVTTEFPFSITADYLQHCGESGQRHLNALILRQPIYTERDALDLLQVCDRFPFLAPHKPRINQVMARVKLSQGRLDEAVAWSQGALAEGLARKLLDDLVVPLATETDAATLARLDQMLDTFNASPMAAKEMHFLRVYSDIIKGWMNQQHRVVTATIVRALTNELAPKRFWLILLRDCAHLLQAASREDSPSTQEVYDLMACLEEIELAHNRPELIKKFEEYVKQENGNVEDEITRIRLVFVQSLASAVLVGGRHR